MHRQKYYYNQTSTTYHLTCLFLPQVVEALKTVNFTVKTKEQVWFDSTGAAAARYEVVNWQQGPDGTVHFKPVGYYDVSLPAGRRFVLSEDSIVWPGGSGQVCL